MRMTGHQCSISEPRATRRPPCVRFSITLGLRRGLRSRLYPVLLKLPLPSFMRLHPPLHVQFPSLVSDDPDLKFSFAAWNFSPSLPSPISSFLFQTIFPQNSPGWLLCVLLAFFPIEMVAAAAAAMVMSVSLASPSSALLRTPGTDKTLSSRLLCVPAASLSSRAALSGGGPKLSCVWRSDVAGGSTNAAMRTIAATMVSPVDLNARRPEVETAIEEAMANCITESFLNDSIPSLGPKIRGKVRDIYEAGDYMVLVTTDRQSAFDRVLASVPFKGQVLNQTSVWWFSNTKHITDNAIVSAPDPNVTIAKKCTVFPVEFVVRGFMTGSTSTSLWTVYDNGVRSYCGNDLVEGMKKNEKLQANIITPTTKAADHDLPISGAEIIEQGLMSKEDYEEVKNKALALFKFGQEVALKHGLLLVDTKYEFGKTSDGTIVLIDEVHTPDSSRYWISASYEERHRQGLEPENIDKEFLRLWFKSKCDPYNDKVLPEAPKELVAELSWRYIVLYETITGSKFMLPDTKEPLHDRIARNVQESLQRLL